MFILHPRQKLPLIRTITRILITVKTFFIELTFFFLNGLYVVRVHNEKYQTPYYLGVLHRLINLSLSTTCNVSLN